MNTRSEFRYSLANAKALRTWMFALAAVAVGVFLYALFSGENIAGLAGVGLVAAVFATVGEWQWRRSFHDRSVRLAIDSTGIFAPDAALKPVPWPEIEIITLAKPRRKKAGFIAVDVADVSKYQPTTETLAMARLNQTFGGGELVIKYGELDGTYLDIRAAILAANPQVNLIDQ